MLQTNISKEICCIQNFLQAKSQSDDITMMLANIQQVGLLFMKEAQLSNENDFNSTRNGSYWEWIQC